MEQHNSTIFPAYSKTKSSSYHLIIHIGVFLCFIIINILTLVLALTLTLAFNFTTPVVFVVVAF